MDSNKRNLLTDSLEPDFSLFIDFNLSKMK